MISSLIFIFRWETKWKTLAAVFLCSRRVFSNLRDTRQKLINASDLLTIHRPSARHNESTHSLPNFLFSAHSSLSLTMIHNITWLTFVQEPFEMGENIRQSSQLFAILKQLRQVVGNRLWRLNLLVIVVIVRLICDELICHHHHFNWFSLLPLLVFNSKEFIHFYTGYSKFALARDSRIVWLFEF